MSMSKLDEIESWRQLRKPGQLQCERCHFCWYPRKRDELPRRCPHCKSARWNLDVGRDFILDNEEHKKSIRAKKVDESKEPGREFLRKLREE